MKTRRDVGFVTQTLGEDPDAVLERVEHGGDLHNCRIGGTRGGTYTEQSGGTLDVVTSM